MGKAHPNGAVVLLTRLSRTAYRAVDEQQLGMGLKQLVLLTHLRDQGATTQAALAEYMHFHPNNLVLLLNSVEDEGWAVRARDPDDRRRHLVSITKDGERALAAAEKALESTADEVLGPLDRDEREALRGLLAKALGT